MRILSLFLILAVCLAACGLPSATPTAIPTATFTPIPTLTPTNSSPQEPAPGFALPTYEPAQVAYDFATNMCAATWGNGSTWFSVCPASRSDAAGGFYAFLDQPGIESNVATNAPAILILPSQRAIFGKYPPFTVQAGDAFHAILACEGDAPCDVEFALEYYDQNGTYHPNARDGAWPLEWHHAAGEGPEPILVDLSNLAGQTVQFTLAVRSVDAPSGSDYALWVQPVILRGSETLPPGTPVVVSPAATAQAPGVISGMVDMTAAPPFLQDDPVVGSAPVVVVFFNQDDGTFWWIHTTLTGHPNYQMTVPPGRYYVMAYARGIPGMEVINAGHTGQSPSCGQPLQIVTVAPGAQVTGIDITDWQQTCSGGAFRPDKPSDVPLP